MIQSFACEQTREFFHTGKCGRVGWQHCTKVAARKLDMLNRVATITELMQPPSNRLERLKGKRSGEHSIRINDQWRVCFVWADNGPENVKIEDYH